MTMTTELSEQFLAQTDFNNDEVYQVLKLGNIKSVAPRYLNIYVGEADWQSHLDILWQRSKNKDVEKFKQIICAAILLPAVDRTTNIDKNNPENLLFKMPYYHQLDTRNWLADFQKTFSRDVDIDTWRGMVLNEGVIHPIDYHPFSRQAYNWLYEKVDDSEDPAVISPKLIRLVQIYGGAVICNIFTRHREKVANLVNWRSGYFFERKIYEVYTFEEILKLKRAELQKTNKKLVKSIRFI